MIECTDVTEWEAWLADNHADSVGVWLKIAKKHSSGRAITIGDALDGALCYGWIDSVRRRLDDDFYLQRYSPRRRSSPWSQVNVAKAEGLIAVGRMRDPGMAAISAAQADGRWAAAYEQQRTAELPDDFRAALAEQPAAQERFDGLDRSARYALFLRLMKTRTATDRAVQLRRIMAELTTIT